MSRKRPRSLTWRLYAFASVIVFVSIGTMIATVIVTPGGPAEHQPGTVQALVDQLDTWFPGDDALIRAFRGEPGLGGIDLSAYDRRGRLIAASGRVLEPPTGAELTVAKGDPLIERDRMVFAMGQDRVAVYAPLDSGPGLVVTLVIVAGVALAITFAATIGFAQTIARPLRELGAAASAFGRGETDARTNLRSNDELGAVGQAFDEMASRIEQLLTTQRVMMTDISHELRTPLTRVKLALDLAGADPQAAQQVLEDAGSDLEEIEQIIDDVFAVVRFDSADAVAARHSDIDLVEIVGRSAVRFEAYHPDHPLAIDATELRHAPVVGDAALLRRALDNLLDNAAKYSPAGEPVRLALRGGPLGYVVEVHDRGVGMSEGELALAFTPFWRADGSRARTSGGVGLGLTFARRVARAHGGDVALDSRPSEGTTARLTVSGASAGSRPSKQTLTRR